MSNTRKAEGSPPPQPQQIGPAPVAQSVTVQEVQDNTGHKWVMLRIDGPTGSFFSFLDPDAAGTIAEKLADVAMHARTGLVVAQGLNGIGLGNPQS